MERLKDPRIEDPHFDGTHWKAQGPNLRIAAKTGKGSAQSKSQMSARKIQGKA